MTLFGALRVSYQMTSIRPPRRDRERAEPVPFRVVNWIVIDPVRRAESDAAIGAAHEHDIAAISEAGWLNTREHVDIVVGACARAVYGEKNLAHQPFRIDRLAEDYVAAQVHRRASIKRWNYTRGCLRLWSEHTKSR